MKITLDNGQVLNTTKFTVEENISPPVPPPSTGIDLINWKLTLPIGTGSKPKEVLQPELKTFKAPPFYQEAMGGGIQFRAPVNGVTTSNSGYPRSSKINQLRLIPHKS